MIKRWSLIHCISDLSVPGTKYLAPRYLKRAGLFGLLVSEASVHGQLALRQKHHGEGHGGGNLLNSWQPGSREEEEQESKEQGTKYSPQGHDPMT